MAARTDQPFAYDTIEYPTVPFPETHPDRIAALAHLQGFSAPDPKTARVLELGAGTGGNLLAAAVTLPDAHLTGVDLSGSAIARGVELASQAQIENVTLHEGDLMDVPDDLGEFDYVIAHGVYSWVPDAVRERTLELCGGLLAPGGVAYVSYNALPGWHMFNLARDAVRRTLKRPDDAERAKREAVNLLKLLRDVHGTRDIYGQFLEQMVEHYHERLANVLFHDELAEGHQAFAFEDVAARAAKHGLTYLTQATPRTWWEWFLSPTDVWKIKTQAGNDRIRQEQLADFAIGRGFKTTLFVGAGQAFDGAIDVTRVLDLWISGKRDFPDERPDAPELEQAIRARVFADRPAPIACRSLADELDGTDRAVADAILRCVVAGEGTLHLTPTSCVNTPGEFPRTSSLARIQAASGEDVATFRHDHVEFEEPLGRALVTLLDGTRDRRLLVRDLTAAALMTGSQGSAEEIAETVAETLEGNLHELALLALLDQ